MREQDRRFHELWRNNARADRRDARRAAFTEVMANIGAHAFAISLFAIAIVIAIEAIRAAALFFGAVL